MKTPMLVQASKLYTPQIFETFQAEYERSMAACTRPLHENNTYAISIVRSDGDLSSEQERIVVGDPLEKKFYVAVTNLKGQVYCVAMD